MRGLKKGMWSGNQGWKGRGGMGKETKENGKKIGTKGGREERAYLDTTPIIYIPNILSLLFNPG